MSQRYHAGMPTNGPHSGGYTSGTYIQGQPPGARSGFDYQPELSYHNPDYNAYNPYMQSQPVTTSRATTQPNGLRSTDNHAPAAMNLDQFGGFHEFGEFERVDQSPQAYSHGHYGTQGKLLESPRGSSGYRLNASRQTENHGRREPKAVERTSNPAASSYSRPVSSGDYAPGLRGDSRRKHEPPQAPSASPAFFVSGPSKQGATRELVDVRSSAGASRTTSAFHGTHIGRIVYDEDPKEFRYECTVSGCSESLGRHQDFKRHFEDKHTESSFSCPHLMCPKTTSRKDKIQLHCREVHGTEYEGMLKRYLPHQNDGTGSFGPEDNYTA